jgi:uncharacterized protein YigE (DUF2233 family)
MLGNSLNNILNRVFLVFLGFILYFCLASIGQAEDQWKSLEKGIEYGILQVQPFPEIGDGTVHIVRIDPAKAKLKLLLASEYSKKSRTTAQWCKEFNLVSAINAGMFHKDLITNVGYLKNGSHIQNKRWNSKYKSVLALDPKKDGIPPAIIIDLDEPDAIKSLSDYNAVVQNLRLMKGNGVNVWAKQDNKWSESAVGMDRDGRILFLFCRSPLTMRDFNEVIKSLGLGVVRMMHMEGGPVASLSIRTPGFTLDLVGSYETTILANDTNKEQWPIPNIIGVQAR